MKAHLVKGGVEVAHLANALHLCAYHPHGGTEMSNRYVAEVSRLLASVLDSPAATPNATRQAVLQAAQRAVADPGTPLRDGSVPPSLLHYVETVSRHAYRVTDADVQELKDAGHTEEEIFDVTVSAAIGSALYRLERGMAALNGTTGGE